MRDSFLGMKFSSADNKQLLLYSAYRDDGAVTHWLSFMWMFRGYLYPILKTLALSDSVNQVITGFQESWVRCIFIVCDWYRCTRHWCMRTLIPLQRHSISNAFFVSGKRGSLLIFPYRCIVPLLSWKRKNFLNKSDSVITQIAQPQASWGQDVQADGADEGRGRAVGCGI